MLMMPHVRILLTQVNAADDLLSSHALGNTSPAFVDETHNVAAFSACLAHDGHLGTCNSSAVADRYTVSL
jgi:hypothetical protein